MSTEELIFSPAWTNPPIIDAESRIRELREMLLDKSKEFQHKNISFLIHLYETGKLPAPPGETTWILDGKLINGEPEKISKGSVAWAERMAYQFMQTTQTPQAGAIQMGQSVSYGLQGAWSMHEIFARFRLIAAFGGDPNTTINVSIGNDTGSNTQTIFTTDLVNLNHNRNTYFGHVGFVSVGTANGVMHREQIQIEIQLISANGTAVSPWFREWALVTPFQPGGTQCRLSGNAMRNHLFFATAPGNTTLFVVEKKNGIVTQLPVV